MLYYLTKLLITCILIVAISEVAKRSSLLGAIMASIPLISVLAMVWLYIDTKDLEKIVALANGIFWLVIPSLVFFIALPILLRNGVNFFPGLFISIGLTAGAYILMVRLLLRFGIQI